MKSEANLAVYTQGNIRRNIAETNGEIRLEEVSIISCLVVTFDDVYIGGFLGHVKDVHPRNFFFIGFL